MRLAIIVVAYGLAEDLLTLYETANRLNIMWHVFLHSQFSDVVKACEKLARERNVCYYPYGVNRGLAKSWNEGLLTAYRQGADVAMIANDDILITYWDVKELAYNALSNPNAYMVSGMGHDLSTNKFDTDMLFSLAAINPIALKTIGYFDQNFYPIYFEDIDYYRRATLAGLERLTVGNTNIIHAGSKSRWSVPANNAQHETTFALNRQYYGRKWGCVDQGTETFTVPFNDARFGLKIAADDRHAPYPGYDRTDQEIVTI